MPKPIRPLGTHENVLISHKFLWSKGYEEEGSQDAHKSQCGPDNWAAGRTVGEEMETEAQAWVAQKDVELGLGYSATRLLQHLFVG